MPALEGYPWLRLPHAIFIARIVTAVCFMAHAIVRIVNGTIPQFAKAMEAQGFPDGMSLVWAITVTELVCGTLLILNRWTRWATIPLLAIVIGGIVLIHRHFGWFVGEHGTGGSEYSVALIALLLVLAAADREDNLAA